MENKLNTPPAALLLLTSQCPHCPTLLQGLGELVKKGLLGRLEVVNIGVRPDVAERLGVRSVPWFRIGEFELEGLHTPAELQELVQRAMRPDGLAQYYTDLFKQGRLPHALSTIRHYPQHIAVLLALAGDPATELTVRIGISAVLEDYAGSPQLQEQLPTLLALARHEDPAIRADASHFLALSHSPEALPVLRQLAEDPVEMVREVATDSLEELTELLDGQPGNMQ